MVGGGHAGYDAAVAAAANRDDRVLLVEQGPSTAGGGGSVTTMLRATALGVYDHGFVVIHERSRPVERLWHVRAERVVLATGAHERPIAFADCDRPGVMLAGAVRRYVGDFGVLPGERAVIFTTNDSTNGLEELLPEVGAEVVAVVDARRGEVVTAAHGDPRVEAVTVRDADGAERTVECDLVAVSGGWNPVTQLWRAIGGGLAYDEDRACFVPNGEGPSWLEVVGAAAGEGLPPSAPLWFSPAEDLSRHFVDLQRDQTVTDVLEAVGGGLRSVEHVKRATYIGTAIDQGRTSGVLTAEIVNGALGWEPGAQGPTNARPPYVPVSFSVLAGPYRKHMLDPGTADVDPSVARRARRRVRERRAVEAPLVLPARRARRWRRRSCASARPCARASASWTRRRSARSRSPGPTPPRSSTACTRTGCRRSRRGGSATA